ncbi:carboxypeptidase regulatory-like domain-containing protein [Niallia oryzisoli]|uniref:carboxypeptidase regulatory-like domain-containing protein n=1 Tax=Niallia oryzisoli TaxID=1737571 RepID=UPI003736679E
MTKSTKNNIRKFLAGAAAAAVVVSVVPTASFAAEFTDVQGHWAKNAIEYLVGKNVLDGYENGTFLPNNDITRAEAAKILALTLGLEIDESKKANFDDIPQSHWASSYVAAIVNNTEGVIGGFGDGTFKPDQKISRQDFAKMIVKAYPQLKLNEATKVEFPDKANYAEAQAAIDILASLGIVGGENGMFLPTDTVTRAEAATFVHRTEKEDVRIDVKIPEALASGVAGFIVTNDTRIEGATVTIDGKTTTTNEAGYFTITNIAPGTYDATITANGFETVVEKVNVSADKVTSFTKDIGAKINTSAIKVSGVIVDHATGAPLDAKVKLESYDEESDAWVTVADVTAEDGAYEINQTDAKNALELGAEYRQTVTLDDYKEFVQTITLDKEEVVNNLNGIQLDAIAAMDLTGAVLNADNTKVTTGTVLLKNADGELAAEPAEIKDGAYKFDNLKLLGGTYTIVVDDNTETSAIYNTTIEVAEGTDLTHDVQLEEGHTINAAFGAEALNDVFNIEDSTYTLELLNGNTVVDTVVLPADSAATTIETLTFTFSRVAPGNYTLRLSGDHVVTANYDVTVDGDEDIEKRVVPAGVVTGTVTGLEGAAVNLLNADGSIKATTKSNASGEYEFTGVEAGDYKVEVSMSGYDTEITAPQTVTKNTVKTIAPITLDAVAITGDVAGFVRLNGSLSPIANATVTYYDADGDQKYSDTTGSNGSYELTSVEAGSYKVVVRGPGMDTFTTNQVVNAGDDLSAVNYSPAVGGDASLTVNFVDNEGNAVEITDTILAELLDDSIDAVDLADGAVPGKLTGEVAENGSSITFEDLSAGSYDLEIDLPEEFVDIDTTATLGSGEEKELKIEVNEVADTHKVNFRVVDETNTNEEDAYVVVFNEDGSIETVLTTTEAGTAELALMDGTYTLAVIRDGYTVAEREVTVEGKDVTVPVIQLTNIQ